MKRRDLLLVSAALAAAPFVTRAQARLPTVGFLLPEPKPSPEVQAERIAKSPFLARLRELGWIEGKTFNAERVYAGPAIEGLSKGAAHLVAKRVDAIWTQGYLATVAAARATKSVPIVFTSVGYVVEAGLVDSFARPGRNVTGQAIYADARALMKHVELLREIAPRARRLAVLSVTAGRNYPTVAGGQADLTSYRNQWNAGFRQLGLENAFFGLATESDFERLLAAIEEWRPDCFSALETPLTARFRNPIVEFARRHRLPDAYQQRSWIEPGGLVSYGINYLPLVLRSMDQLDRILRGAKPADLPVELPTHYDVAVNLKTARALGLDVPPSVLTRADRVIE